MNDSEPILVSDAVTASDIALVVARATGIPVQVRDGALGPFQTV